MKSKRCARDDCSGWHPLSGLIPSVGSVDGEGSQTLPLETALSWDELTWPRSYKSVRVNRKEKGHSHWLVHVGDEGPLTSVLHGGPLWRAILIPVSPTASSFVVPELQFSFSLCPSLLLHRYCSREYLLIYYLHTCLHLRVYFIENPLRQRKKKNPFRHAQRGMINREQWWL